MSPAYYGREPQHRYSRCQRRDASRTYHVSRVLAAVAAANNLLELLQPVQAGVYRCQPGIVLRCRSAVADAMPYVLADGEGYLL